MRRNFDPKDLILKPPQIVTAPDALPLETTRQVFLVPVTVASAADQRKAVWQCARWFAWESDFDSVMYGYEGREDDDRARAYLWIQRLWDKPERSVVLGACCFRWREYRDAPPAYALQWVWLHPFCRRQGYLRDAWQFFRDACGDFTVETPVSPAMKEFLERVSPETQLS